jgi:hypothetical protein
MSLLIPPVPASPVAANVEEEGRRPTDVCGLSPSQCGNHQE